MGGRHVGGGGSKGCRKGALQGPREGLLGPRMASFSLTHRPQLIRARSRSTYWARLASMDPKQ
eukprot:8574994-Pyramimonas_sp.AAC.1